MAITDYSYNKGPGTTRQIIAGAEFKLVPHQKFDKLIMTFVDPGVSSTMKLTQRLVITLDSQELVRLMKLLSGQQP